MALHALQRDGDVRFRRLVELALYRSPMKVLNRPDELVTVARQESVH
jgi:hypothetical protein